MEEPDAQVLLATAELLGQALLWAAGHADSGPAPSLLPAPGAADALTSFERAMLADAHALASRQPTRAPLALQHKVLVRRLHDRRPLLRTFADKAATRDHVVRRVGERALPRLLDVCHSADELTPERLRGELVVRASHCSGGVLVLREGPPTTYIDNPPWWRGSFAPADVPWDEVRGQLDGVMGRDYGLWGLEWAYLRLPRALLVEELVRGPAGGPPRELMVFCYDGVPRLVRLGADRWTEERTRSLLPDGREVINGNLNPRGSARDLPGCWAEALELAAEVSRGLDFARVDLLEADRGPLVGEITVYPGHGVLPLSAPDDLVRGMWWTLPSLEEMCSPYA